MVASSDPPAGDARPEATSEPGPAQDENQKPIAAESTDPTQAPLTEDLGLPALIQAGDKSKPPAPTDASEHIPTAAATSGTETAQKVEAAPTTSSAASIDDDVNPLDFKGSVDSNDELPGTETLHKISNYIVLDGDGKSHTFKSLYSGKHVARRVLIIFVRHFFCGNCQEYLRTLCESITPEALLRLPITTFIAVIGCGDPKLIDMYASETGCSFPIYADPTRKLYDELGMIRTLSLGPRPAYMKKSLLKSSLQSVAQGLKQIKTGLVMKAGDQRQIGGEFLFEPLTLHTPISTPWMEDAPRIISEGTTNGGAAPAASEQSLDGAGYDEAGEVEEKRVTWCHRMKNTRDHAEIPELMEILGLDGHGKPVDDNKRRWSKALEQRKGTGLSMASQMKAEAEALAAAAARPGASTA